MHLSCQAQNTLKVLSYRTWEMLNVRDQLRKSLISFWINMANNSMPLLVVFLLLFSDLIENSFCEGLWLNRIESVLAFCLPYDVVEVDWTLPEKKASLFLSGRSSYMHLEEFWKDVECDYIGVEFGGEIRFQVMFTPRLRVTLSFPIIWEVPSAILIDCGLISWRSSKRLLSLKKLCVAPESM